MTTHAKTRTLTIHCFDKFGDEFHTQTVAVNVSVSDSEFCFSNTLESILDRIDWDHHMTRDHSFQYTIDDANGAKIHDGDWHSNYYELRSGIPRRAKYENRHKYL